MSSALFFSLLSFYHEIGIYEYVHMDCEVCKLLMPIMYSHYVNMRFGRRIFVLNLNKWNNGNYWIMPGYADTFACLKFTSGVKMWCLHLLIPRHIGILFKFYHNARSFKFFNISDKNFVTEERLQNVKVLVFQIFSEFIKVILTLIPPFEHSLFTYLQ